MILTVSVSLVTHSAVVELSASHCNALVSDRFTCNGTSPSSNRTCDGHSIPEVRRFLMHLWKRRSASSTLTLLFVGDSISHQHWLATVLLLRSHVSLQCPSLLAQWAYVLEGRPMPSWTLWALTSWSRLALRVFPQPRRLLGGSTLMTCAVLWPQGRRPRAPSWRGTRPWLKVCYAKAAMRNADAEFKEGDSTTLVNRPALRKAAAAQAARRHLSL